MAQTTSLHQFLPALLEIQESPPNPIARRLLATILAFVFIAVTWACVGKVDVVSIAQGKIIPSARVKQVQPLTRGVVTEIRVQEGQQVKAGDVLVVLDRTSTGADRASVQHEQQTIADTLARQRALVEHLTSSPLCAAGFDSAQPAHNRSLSEVEGSEVEGSETSPWVSNPVQQSLLEQQYSQFCAQYNALQSQRDNRVAEREVNKSTISKLTATLPVLTQRVANSKGLVDKKLAMENDYLALEEMRLSQQHDLTAAKARDTQLSAAIKESEQQQAALVAQTKAQAFTAIAEAERQLQGLQEQLTKVEGVDARQVLLAPVDGEVKDLAINTVGGVVVEAQQLMLIVPEEEKLEVEAWLPNQDIGFVQEGAQAQIKVHTFPFSRYGTISADVVRISDDAVSPEKSLAARQGMAGGERDGEAMYSMSLRMARNSLQVDGREVKLVPGMQVTAEIITHQRRIIEYFFSPIKKQLQESIHER